MAAAVWGATTRTITGGVPTASDNANAVWAAGTRSLTTAFPSVPSTVEIANSVWGATTRTITGGNLSNSFPAVPTSTEIAGAVWGATARSLTTAFPTVPTAGDNASAVWQAAQRTLTSVDVAIPNVPTAAETAAAVWGTANRTLTSSSDPTVANIQSACDAAIGGKLSAIADAVLTRDVSNVEASAGKHSLCFPVLAMSEWTIVDNAGCMTVYQTDGETEFTRRQLTRNRHQASPIVAMKKCG
jgi:hypothetical protein